MRKRQHCHGGVIPRGNPGSAHSAWPGMCQNADSQACPRPAGMGLQVTEDGSGLKTQSKRGGERKGIPSLVYRGVGNYRGGQSGKRPEYRFFF